MHTIIRDRRTATPDFVFYADRLLRLVRPVYVATYTCTSICAAEPFLSSSSLFHSGLLRAPATWPDKRGEAHVSIPHGEPCGL